VTDMPTPTENAERTPPYKVLAVAGLMVLALIGALVFVQFRGGFTPKQSLTLIADRAGLLVGPDSKVTFNGVEVGKVAAIDLIERDEGGVLALHAHLVEHRDAVGLVKGTDRERDVRALDIVVEQRAAALGAVAAVDLAGTAEAGGLAARPGQVLVAHADQRGEQVDPGGQVVDVVGHPGPVEVPAGQVLRSDLGAVGCAPTERG